MGQYINPPAVVAELGERLDTYDYERARALAGDRLLIVLHDLGLYKTAAIIPAANEWADQLGVQAPGADTHLTIYQQGVATVIDPPLTPRGFAIYAVSADALRAAGARF